MKQVTLLQGSPEWHAFRSTKFTASDAPAMLGLSKYKARDQLLHEKHTGTSPEVSEHQQRLFDKGHQAEALARPFVEDEIGEDLYPVTGVSDEWEKISASFDGLTLSGEIAFEHKQWNEELASFIKNEKDLPNTHWPQVEQLLYVSGAKECIFVVSDGTLNKRVLIVYKSNPERLAMVINGWKQFEKDLASYAPPAETVEAVAEEVTELPAIYMAAKGEVSIANNLDVFERGLTVFLNEKLIREPKDDNDFATLDLQIKAMKKAEDALEAAGESVLAQVEAVDRAMKKKDSLRELVRDNRLMAEKLLKSEKDRRRMEIHQAATAQVDAFMVDLNDEVGFRIPSPSLCLAGAMKGKKTIASLQSAANDEVARAKIEARQVADNALANVKSIASICKPDYATLLFPDLHSLAVSKSNTDFVEIAKARVIQHEAALEKARIDAAEAEKKRAEDESKKQAEAVAEPEVIEKPALADIPVKPASELLKPKKSLSDKLYDFCLSRGLTAGDASELAAIVEDHFKK